LELIHKDRKKDIFVNLVNDASNEIKKWSKTFPKTFYFCKNV
jgi:hypothetical protein